MIYIYILLFIFIHFVIFVSFSNAYTHFQDIEIFKDISYIGTKEKNSHLRTLDIYKPLFTTKECPVMIFIHGGYWIQGDKGSLDYKAEYFTNLDWVLVNVNYRLSPEVMHPVHTQDIANAISWVYNNIYKYKGDPSRIFVMGYSAGAHIAALVATDEKYLRQKGLGIDIIKGVILLESAYYDIPRRVNSEPYDETIHQMVFGVNPELWYDASPINHVEKGKNIPPFLLVHTKLNERHHFQALALSQTLQKSDIYAQTYYAMDKDHVTLNNDLGKPEDNTTKIILQFLNDRLGAPE